MRTYLSTLKKSAGFTLIELLVVIGILGILAAALIATIDPFEQLKKATDANTKNTVVEFVNANIRYYATHNGMPWYATDAGGVAGCGVSSTDMSVGSAMTCIGNTSSGLIGDGELKESFSKATNILKYMSYYGTSTSPGLITCFLPVSKSQKRDPGTIYSASGVAIANPSTNCVGYGGASTCYWCAQ